MKTAIDYSFRLVLLLFATALAYWLYMLISLLPDMSVRICGELLLFVMCIKWGLMVVLFNTKTE